MGVEALPHFEKEAKESQKRKPAGFVPEQIPGQKPEGEARERVAKLLHINPHYVSDAKMIKEKAPEQFEAIKNGEKTITEVKREMNKAAAIKRVAELPSDKFRVFYADPPWKYGDTRELDDWSGTAADHH